MAIRQANGNSLHSSQVLLAIAVLSLLVRLEARAFGQVEPDELGTAARPEFGRGRPTGAGFRPSGAGTTRGLRRRTGLQDAMAAARLDPLLSVPAERTTPVARNRIAQAIQALRTTQEQRRQQLASQATGQAGRTQRLPHVVRLNVAPPGLVEPIAIEERIQMYLSPRAPSGGPVQLGVDASVELRQEEGKLVLEGTVESPSHRRVVEQLVRLEPGVYDVENRLQIKPAHSSRGE